MLTTKSNARLADLDAVRSNSLLKLIALANADRRPEKIDVGVGVYRDGQGRTPVMRAVKAAEKKLWESPGQQVLSRRRRRHGLSRAAEADRARRACRRRADRRLADSGRLRGAAPRLPAGRQRPIRRRGCWSACRPGRTMCRSSPAAGSRSPNIPITTATPAEIRFDAMMAAIERRAAPATSSCCTAAATIRPAPTLTPDQWREVARAVAERGLIPLRRHRLPGARPRARRGRRRACAAFSTPATKCWSRRAATRISASIATASAACSSRRRAARRATMPWAMCCRSRAKCGRCRPTMAAPSSALCWRTKR